MFPEVQDVFSLQKMFDAIFKSCITISSNFDRDTNSFGAYIH